MSKICDWHGCGEGATALYLDLGVVGEEPHENKRFGIKCGGFDVCAKHRAEITNRVVAIAEIVVRAGAKNVDGWEYDRTEAG